MGWVFLHILSAEGRHHPDNAAISGDEYEASRQAVLDGLRQRRPPIPADQTEREAMLGCGLIGIQKIKREED